MASAAHVTISKYIALSAKPVSHGAESPNTITKLSKNAFADLDLSIFKEDVVIVMMINTMIVINKLAYQSVGLINIGSMEHVSV
jgi:hypothetical protein